MSGSSSPVEETGRIMLSVSHVAEKREHKQIIMSREEARGMLQQACTMYQEVKYM
jgi:hypothetical protein